MNHVVNRKRADTIYTAFYLYHEDIVIYTIEELEATLDIYHRESGTPVFDAIKKRLATLIQQKKDKEKYNRKIIISLLIIIVGGILGGIIMNRYFP